MKTVAFFNNKGGVGKTSLVYHLAWMLSELGHSVLAIDLDPQSNLSSAFLEEEELERLWPVGEHPQTILGAVQPLIERLGDIKRPVPVRVKKNLHLVVGDLGLSVFEDRLSEAWKTCLDDNLANSGDGFRVMTSFYRILKNACEDKDAEIALIDVGPNVGAMNRAAMVAADYVVIPLGADLFSLQGLRNLGPTLRGWRRGWETRRDVATNPVSDMPHGLMRPLGYVLLNPSVRSNRPVKSYAKWADRIPDIYYSEVLGLSESPAPSRENDPSCLSMMKHYKSLMPMAQDARKPMFALKSSDGAIGGHAAAVQDCYEQFEDLANKIVSLVV